MKLISGFVLHNVDQDCMAIATGEALEKFNGLVRNNETAGFIFGLLQEDTSEEKIVDAMCAEYNAPREVITADVHRIINQIREAGLLEE